MAVTAFSGQAPVLGDRVYLHDSAVLIGQVWLADDVSIWPGAVVRGDVERIHIGRGSNIQDGSVLHVSHAGPFSPQGRALIMGDGVTVGHRAVIHACKIGDYCLIGIGAIILDGAVLEDNVMLGAGALVPPGKVLAGGFLYVGMPAKQVRALTTEERTFLRYSAEHYVELKNRYLKQAKK